MPVNLRGREMEAKELIWGGAIPLQIHLHESEVTTLPSPPPALILAPRIGYLPLLASHIKPHFASALPPGADTIWFEYKGLPLKWYIQTGVLFDLLCAEPERPWNLTVHFRGYPSYMLPCEDGDSLKWSFINSLKEAAYIINGNCKNVMNMSQNDQLELWRSVLNADMTAFLRISTKLKLGIGGDEYAPKLNSSSPRTQYNTAGAYVSGQGITGRVPIRLYIRGISEDLNDLEEAPQIDNWDEISYINQPIEVHEEEGKCFTLHDAIKRLLPEFFPHEASSSADDELTTVEAEDEERISMGTMAESSDLNKDCTSPSPHVSRIALIRIQGIEPKLEIPFSWIVNNLTNPEHFLHICVFIRVSPLNG